MAASAIGLAAGSASAKARPLFFQRIGKPIGLQVYTLGDEIAKDLEGGFARLAAMGYRDLELPNLLGKKPAELRAAADKAGLRISSIHLSMNGNEPPAMLSMLSSPQRIADDLGTLGAISGVLPIAPFPKGFSVNKGEDMKAAIGRNFAAAGEDHWKRAAAKLNEKGAALKPYGIALGYHNHNVEFAPIGNTTGWDVLVKETDPSLVFFEVDLGWIAAAGLDPADFLRRHAGRVRWLHVKDLKASTRTNFALGMDPTEVGSGKQDWVRILSAAEKAGVHNYYVEQEPPFAMARFDAAAKSAAFLSKLRA
jgi:sugar phosphate isomerase/epimerase